MSPRRGGPEDFTGMNPSNTGHGRQNPSKNCKKKPESEEEDKEEEEKEEEEEEEEIATALESKETMKGHGRKGKSGLQSTKLTEPIIKIEPGAINQTHL